MWVRSENLIGAANGTTARREDALQRQGRAALSRAHRVRRLSREKSERESTRRIRARAAHGGRRLCCGQATLAWAAVSAAISLASATIVKALIEQIAARIVSHVIGRE